MNASAPTPDRSHQHRPGSVHDRRLLGRLLTYALPHAWAIGATIVLLVSQLSLKLLGPEIIQRTIDGPVARAMDAGSERSELLGEVRDYALQYAVIVAAMALLFLAREWLTHRTGQRIIYEVRNRLFGHMLRLPIAWFDRHHVGWAVTRSTSDVDALSEMFTTGISTIVSDLLMIVVLIVALVWIAPPLSIVALVVLPIMIYVSFRFRLNARRAFRATRESLSRLNAFLQERLVGLGVVRLFRRERASANRFDELNSVYYRDNLVTVRHFSLFFPTVDVLANAIKIGTLALGAYLLFEGRLTAGVLLQFWFYLVFIFDPIRELAERYNILQAAMAAAERIFGILDTPTEMQAAAVPADVPDTVEEVLAVRTGAAGADAPAPRVDDPDAPAIEFERVSFSYPTGPPVLHEVSFRVRRGERVAVVGHTGAGKTTLVNLLCRFHETPRGRVRIHGHDIDALSHHELRSRIAIVQQDVFLFSDTIANNIRMGNAEMPMQRVREMAAAVHAERFVEAQPDGFETMLTERGANLSSGQRQLLAFARALAADPDILVLDEATSSVDSETEALIEDATAVLMQGRTSLVIAHRLSTIVNADRILVMHKGELREQGTHDELMAQRGLYHKLYKLHLSSSA